MLTSELLRTKSNLGKVIQYRPFLDNGSQNSLISESSENRFNSPLVKTGHRLVGINGISVATCLHSTKFQLAPNSVDYFQSIKSFVVGWFSTHLPNFQL